MNAGFDIWKTIAGLAIFLLGMTFLENSLKQLAGRRFKLFLRKQTSNKFKAIAGGAVVTGILQSSSVVSLMVLAFVGANVISMQNALAVILGANFGTTLDSWIVATLGFKFNIESIAYPVTGIAGISLVFFKKDSKLYNWSYFLIGFGFLFIGLAFIKTGIEATVKNIDLASFRHFPLIVFVGLGFLVTSLIQSSSATIAITLSALNAQAILFPQATAIVLGSEVGTTLKLLLASADGNAAKKRVATGNFLFNMVTLLIVFSFLPFVIRIIKSYIGIGDDLLALVFFQSLINIVSIILFLPFLNILGRFLEKRFVKTNKKTLYVHKISVGDVVLAIDAMKQETKHLAGLTVAFCRQCFDITSQVGEEKESSVAEQYDFIKYLHGEIQAYYIQIQKNTTDKKDIEELDQLISSVRNCMYAAKSMKDGYKDAQLLKNSSNDAKYDFYLKMRERAGKVCDRFDAMLALKNGQNYFDELSGIYRTVTSGYTATLQYLYKETVTEKMDEKEISTLINFNREVVTAFKSLLFGIKDILLDEKQANFFDELPGFIR